MATYCPYCMTRLAVPGRRCPDCGEDPSGYHPSNHHLPTEYLLRDHYLVGRVLGEGGFGITYLGVDTTLERRVAIKEYFPSIFVYRETSSSSDVTCYTGETQTLYEKGRDQFLQEARVMAQLDGLPEIVQVLDFFPANNTAYIVMELLTGNTLRTLLDQQGRIPAKQLFEMMESVLRAVNTMHSSGIIHRDISPDNIMILNNGKIKLLDFGCARPMDMGRTMTAMLKRGYAPIEQYTGYDQGPWTDVYALCATCYHCLTGQVPPESLARMTGLDPLIPPNELGAALSPEQEEALLCGLAVEVKSRWQSIPSLYAALYNEVITPEPDPNPVPKPQPKPVPLKNLWIGIAACCLVALIAIVGFVAIRGNSSEEPSARSFLPNITEPQGESSDVNELGIPKKRVVIGPHSTISAGVRHTVALKSDSTVVAVGDNEDGQCNVDEWTDIVEISAGYNHTLGLKSDGMVVAVGCNDSGECNVAGVTDVVTIAAGAHFTVVVKSDGTVSAGGRNSYGQCNVDDWTDIVAVSAGTDHTVGLKSDGTVVAVGSNKDGQCNVDDWTDITTIFAGPFITLGVKSDGTVVASGPESQCSDVTDWTDIVTVSANIFCTAGLKLDGTVVTSGNTGNSYFDRVTSWTDIVAIAVGDNCIIGLKSDGRVVEAGNDGHGECEVAGWSNVRIPTVDTDTGELRVTDSQTDGTATKDDGSERIAVVYDCEDFSFYPQLTSEQNALINNLPVNELPREAVELSNLRKEQIWRDTLVPLAADTIHDVTLYGAISAEWLSEDPHQANEILYNLDNMDEPLVVLRIGDKIAIQNLSWNKNAWNLKNPWLEVDDFDGDGKNEIAVCTYAISGMGTDIHQLWIYDPETFKSYTPIVSDLGAKFEADWGEGKLNLYSGPYTVTQDIEKYIMDRPDLQFVTYGYIINYFYDENRLGQKLLCTISLVYGDGGGVGYGWPFADVTAPIIFSEGQYRLGLTLDIALT